MAGGKAMDRLYEWPFESLRTKWKRVSWPLMKGDRKGKNLRPPNESIRMRSRLKSKATSIRPVLFRHAWLLYGLFTLTSVLLSYAPLSLTIKMELGLFGILLPFVWTLLRIIREPAVRGVLLIEEEILPRSSYWVILPILALAIDLRFADLTTWPVWPNTDEGLVARFGLDLFNHRQWSFFYNQIPPGIHWLFCFFSAKMADLLMGLWLLPACLSTLAFFLCYFAFRPLVSRSTAFMAFTLWGLSFWPFFYGRFCHPGVLLPLWECLALAALGFYLKAKTQLARIGRGALLGLVAGFGSLTFTPWPIFALWILGVVTLETIHGKKSKTPLMVFALFFIVCLIPFFRAVFIEGFGHPIFAVSSGQGDMPLAKGVLAFFSYLTAPFWGVFEAQPAYAPVWGGMFNPILTGAFWLGLLESFRHRRNPKVRWAWAGGILCMAPGLFSMNVDMFRVVLVIPFLLLGSAWGLLRLMKEAPLPQRVMVLVSLLAVSLVLDVTHLATPHFFHLESARGPMRGVPPPKMMNSYRAYQILKEESSRGPGYFFNDFTSMPYDQSLDCGVYAFNALENPKLPKNKVRWAAFLVNSCYEPFLKKSFPEGKWFWVDQDVQAADGGEMLGVIPVDDSNQDLFAQWVEAYPAFRDMDWGWLELADFQKAEGLLNDFAKVKPLLEDDPFLTSIYWEKTSDLLYRDKAYPNDQQALGQALREGYPCAQFFYKRGSIELRKNRFASARADLNEALKAPGNRTLAASALTMLEEIEKEGGLPPSQ